jgi:AraC family transcriptional regulator, regulatory protein of adaptative response / methylated-DNA-[protein]-cysteine methyltransferase
MSRQDRETPVLDWELCERARVARDRRYDGVFFTAVRTTGIYCRPICPVRPALPKNVMFFRTAAEAEQAGFRPCLRCRPETAPGSPAWLGTETTVIRGMRLIEEGFLDRGTVAQLADRLGVGPRHLCRLFIRHVGAGPRAVASTRRVQAAKRLIDQTDLPLTKIAFAAGFGSVRRFNVAFLQTYSRPPSSLRRAMKRSSPAHPNGFSPDFL